MPASASRCASALLENQGHHRENGTERTSAMALTPALLSKAMKRSAARLEWPMVNRSQEGIIFDARSRASARGQIGDEVVHGAGEPLEHGKVEPIDRDENADPTRRRQHHVRHETGDAAALCQDHRALLPGHRDDPPQSKPSIFSPPTPTAALSPSCQR